MALTLDDPAVVDLHIVQGSSKHASYAWNRDGVRVPLDTYEASAQIRKTPNGLVIANLTPYLTIDTDLDEVFMDLPATFTDTIRSNGVWDLFLTNPNDPADAVKLLYGQVKVKLRVTRLVP